MNLQIQTVEKFKRVQYLLANELVDGEPISIKAACKRGGLSLVSFYKMRKFYDLNFKVEIKQDAGNAAPKNAAGDVIPAENIGE